MGQSGDEFGSREAALQPPPEPRVLETPAPPEPKKKQSEEGGTETVCWQPEFPLEKSLVAMLGRVPRASVAAYAENTQHIMSFLSTDQEIAVGVAGLDVTPFVLEAISMALVNVFQVPDTIHFKVEFIFEYSPHKQAFCTFQWPCLPLLAADLTQARQSRVMDVRTNELTIVPHVSLFFASFSRIDNTAKPQGSRAAEAPVCARSFEQVKAFIDIKKPPISILESAKVVGSADVDVGQDPDVKYICASFEASNMACKPVLLDSADYGSGATRKRQYFLVFQASREKTSKVTQTVTKLLGATIGPLHHKNFMLSEETISENGSQTFDRIPKKAKTDADWRAENAKWYTDFDVSWPPVFRGKALWSAWPEIHPTHNFTSERQTGERDPQAPFSDSYP